MRWHQSVVNGRNNGEPVGSSNFVDLLHVVDAHGVSIHKRLELVLPVLPCGMIPRVTRPDRAVKGHGDFEGGGATGSRSVWLGADAMSQLCSADEVHDPLVRHALRDRALDKHAVGRHCYATGGVARNMETLAGSGASSSVPKFHFEQTCNGVLYLYCFWWHPFLEGLLSVLSLKSKLVSTVLGPLLT